MGLARVEALWDEGSTQQAMLRWYEVPEATHTGRQVGASSSRGTGGAGSRDG